MIYIEDLKKYTKVYDYLKSKPLKCADLGFMFEYCHNCIWCKNSDAVFASFPQDLQDRIIVWAGNLTNLYLFSEDKDKNHLKELRRNLNKEGLKLAKEVNKIYSGSVSYFDEITCETIYLKKN